MNLDDDSSEGRQTQVLLTIRGQVQGVGYRASAADQARSLGLRGWVRNRPNSDVELCAEGPEEIVQRLIDWCHRGPPAARVMAVEIMTQTATGEFPDFRIRRDE